MFYLLNIFKHLMRCSKYLNKFEIFIIFLISFTTMKKVVKKKETINLKSVVWRNIVHMEKSNDGK